MKSNEIIVSVFAMLALMLLAAGTTSAAVYCGSATVKEVSVRPELKSEVASMYALRIDCDDAAWDSAEANVSGGNIEFVFMSQIGDVGYATALTAMATGAKISLTAEGIQWDSLATKIKLLSQVN